MDKWFPWRCRIFFQHSLFNFQRLTTTQLKHDGRQFHKVWDTIFSLDWSVWPSFFIHLQIPGADDLAAEGGVPLLHCLPSTGWPGLQSPKSSQTSGNHDYINISKLKRVLSNFLFIATCNLSAALKHCK